jgi:hypothetical protein
MWRHGLWLEAGRAFVATLPDPRRLRTLRPDPTYVAWRTATAYGSPEAEVPVSDVVAYLRWRRLQRRAGT